MSPYIFYLAMKIFSALLKREVALKHIALIPKCKGINLSHLAFVDDLMIFSRENEVSLQGVNNVLGIFSNIYGLQVNKNKS